MLDGATYSLIWEGIRLLFLLLVPFVLAVGLVGLVFGALQGATTIRDSASAYAVRLLALIASIYVILPIYLSTIIDFAERSFGG